MMDESLYALGEMDRRLGNMLRFGTVSEVDTAKAVAKIDIGDLITDWIPWMAARAGHDRTWRAPDIGEQVVVLSPGDPSQGVILGAVFQTAHPANGNSQDVERTTYKDGTVVEYDRANHRLLVDASASNGDILLEVGSGTVTVNCKTATINASESTAVNTAEATVNASESTTVNTPVATVNASTKVTLDTPNTYCTGNLIVTRSLGVLGTGVAGKSARIVGDLEIIGNTTQQGAVAINGDSLTHNGKNVGSSHTHSEVQPGTGVSGAPS